MKSLKAFISSILIFSISFGVEAQINFRNIVELSVDAGISNDLSTRGIYNTFTASRNIITENRGFVLTRNLSLSYLFLLNKNNGIKLHSGYSSFGFDFEGKFEITEIPVKGSYEVYYLEFGVSYHRRVQLSEFTTFLFESGLRYHSDASFSSALISFRNVDSYSFANYAGIEIPMAGNKWFVNLGMIVKLPLKSYGNETSNAILPAFYPYFIGFKLGVNYQF